jgi:hypothetical protein
MGPWHRRTWRLFAAVILASACAHPPRVRTSSGSARRSIESRDRSAHYPPAFRYYGGATLSARIASIAGELGVDSKDVGVDPLGCVHTVIFRDAARVPVGPSASGSFSEREMKAWSKVFDAHRDAFCIPRDERLHVDKVAGSPMQVRGDAEQRIRLTKYPEVGPDGTRRDVVRVDGNLWSPPELPAPRVEVESVVRDLLGRPYTFRMRAVGTGPQCRGCPAPPPDLDLGSIDTTAELEDFTTTGPMLQLVCGRSSTVELRHVLVVRFRPEVHEVIRRTTRQWLKVPSDRSYRVISAVENSESEFPTRTVDAVTGEAIPLQGWRFGQESWRPEMCGTDS